MVAAAVRAVERMAARVVVARVEAMSAVATAAVATVAATVVAATVAALAVALEAAVIRSRMSDPGRTRHRCIGHQTLPASAATVWPCHSASVVSPA